MKHKWIDQNKIKKDLADFFNNNHSDLMTFGNTVNQTFEAFVFAAVIRWYRENGWSVKIKNPSHTKGLVNLKYSTRGRPDRYTYAISQKGSNWIEIRHNIRVRSAFSNDEVPQASFVVDVGIILKGSAEGFRSKDAVDNKKFITFAEAKHMNAFAELIGSFIGLVHELKPKNLKKLKNKEKSNHIAPFLFVSGFTNPSGKGVCETIKKRGFNISIIDRESKELLGISLQKIPEIPPMRKK